MNRIDFSIDIETLDTKPTSAILSIGCVAFKIATAKIVDFYYAEIDIDSALQYGSVSGSTLSWWMRQNHDAKQVFNEDGLKRSLNNALSELNSHILTVTNRAAVEAKGIHVWGNGSSFDISILDHAYAHCGIGQVWDFRKVRDMRTLVDETEFDVTLIPSVGTHHNALDDAEWQAKVISAAWQRMRGCIERDRALATL